MRARQASDARLAAATRSDPAPCLCLFIAFVALRRLDDRAGNQPNRRESTPTQKDEVGFSATYAYRDRRRSTESTWTHCRNRWRPSKLASPSRATSGARCRARASCQRDATSAALAVTSCTARLVLRGCRGLSWKLHSQLVQQHQKRRGKRKCQQGSDDSCQCPTGQQCDENHR